MHSLSLAGLALAATTTTLATDIQFFIPGFRADMGITPGASIISAGPSTTVMALGCPSSAPSSSSSSDDEESDSDPNCPWGSQALTVSVMGSARYALSVPGAGASFDCTSKGDMTCTAGIAQEFTDAGSFFSAGTDGRATGTTVYPKSEVEFQTARVTAGEEKLSAGAGESSAGKTSAEAPKETGKEKETMRTAASTGAVPTETGAVATGSAEGTPSGTSSAAPDKATGAAARFGVEGAALLVLAGAVAHVL